MPKIYRSANVLLIDKNQNFLLQLRDDKPGIFYPNYVGLFGGGIEPGETPEEAAKRELEEETELTPTLKFLFKFKMSEPMYDADMEFYIFIATRVNENTIVLHEGQKVYVIRASDNLDSHNLNPNAKETLMRYIKMRKEHI